MRPAASSRLPGAVEASRIAPLPVTLPALPRAVAAPPDDYVRPLIGRRVRIRGALGGEFLGVLLGVTMHEIKLELVNGQHVVLFKHAVGAIEVRE